MPARTLLHRVAPLAALAVTVSLPAQVQWSRFEYFPRTSGPLAYDGGRDRFVQLAAPNGIGTPETWEWDRNAGWLRRQPINSPPYWPGNAMAHDAARGITVSFGASGWLYSLVHEWNGVDWTNVSPAVQPSVRQGHAMVFDVVRGKVVLFGGRSPNPNGPDYGDTWEWDGAQWTLRAIAGPMPRHGHG